MHNTFIKEGRYSSQEAAPSDLGLPSGLESATSSKKGAFP